MEKEIDDAIEGLGEVYETLKNRPGWKKLVFKGDDGPYIKTGFAYRFDQTKYLSVEDIISLIRELKETGARG